MSESKHPTGPEIIRDLVKRLPGRPGVYRMVDAEGGVIYVGKTRNLKNRVANYMRMGGKPFYELPASLGARTTTLLRRLRAVRPMESH